MITTDNFNKRLLFLNSAENQNQISAKIKKHKKNHYLNNNDKGKVQKPLDDYSETLENEYIKLRSTNSK